jgi:hypothetical protein
VNGNVGKIMGSEHQTASVRASPNYLSAETFQS